MTLKRTLRSALAIVLALCFVLLCACSTPRLALTVGGKEYEMGDFLAYAFVSSSSATQSDYTLMLLMYQYGAEALNMNYSEAQTKEDGTVIPAVSVREYLETQAQDAILRQRALEMLMEKYGIQWDAEELKIVEDNLKALTPDQFIAYGFNNERYINMYKAMSLGEVSLFNGLYDKGGKKEVPEEDIKTFFTENYLSYYGFEVQLYDSTGKELSDTAKEKYVALFEKLKKQFNESGKKEADFQKIYDEYLKESAAIQEEIKKESASTTTTTTAGTGTTTTAAGATTTTAATTTTTTAKPTTTTTTTTAATTTTTTTAGGTTVSGATTTTTTTAGGSSSGSTTVTDKEDENKVQRQDITKKDDGADEEFIKKLEAAKTGEATVFTYNKTGDKTKPTLSLVFRLELEADRGNDKDGKPIVFYEESRDRSLQLMKYDEFDKEVTAKMDELRKTMVVNKKAMKAVDWALMLGLA